MITVRFQTWVEADSLDEAWEKLRLSLEDKRMGDKLKAKFGACILEDPDEDKARMKGELTAREALSFCDTTIGIDCEKCPLSESRKTCPFGQALSSEVDWEKITKIIRGYKPEGEER